MEDSPPPKQEISRLINVLEALKQASHDLQSHPLPKSYDSFRPLLELETESDTILSKDPNLFSLSQHLSQLKSLVNTLQSSRAHHSFKNFLTRRVSTHSITRVAESIESEIQAWIDRESIDNLKGLLKNRSWDEPELIRLLTQFEKRISQGFDRDLQDLILKSKIFVLLENIICDSSCLISVREQCAFVVAASISFNKDVFVGQVLMGSLIHALVSMGSWGSIKVLCTLIKLVKSPLVDEIESNGEIPKIISFLDYKDLELKVVSLDCVLAIGYFGRKEAIEVMIKEGLIKKLVELQRLEIGGNLVDMELKFDEEKREEESCRENREKGFLESHPFASCVARFAVQLEVGEGLRQREKRAFKQVVLERVREGSVSDAEAATIVAEVLWGSSP